VTGPLGEFAAGFAEDLRTRGYSEVSTWHHMCLYARFSAWLARAHLCASEISPAEIEGYLRARRAANPTGSRTERALAPLLGYLRRLGVLAEFAAPAPEGAPRFCSSAIAGASCASGPLRREPWSGTSQPRGSSSPGESSTRATLLA